MHPINTIAHVAHNLLVHRPLAGFQRVAYTEISKAKQIWGIAKHIVSQAVSFLSETLTAKGQALHFTPETLAAPSQAIHCTGQAKHFITLAKQLVPLAKPPMAKAIVFTCVAITMCCQTFKPTFLTITLVFLANHNISRPPPVCTKTIKIKSTKSITLTAAS